MPFFTPDREPCELADRLALEDELAPVRRAMRAWAEPFRAPAQ